MPAKREESSAWEIISASKFFMMNSKTSPHEIGKAITKKQRQYMETVVGRVHVLLPFRIFWNSRERRVE